MKLAQLRTVLGTALALALTTTAALAAASKISSVMKTVMKGDTSTYKLVATGKGTDADAKKLAECLKGLAGTKPPRGDAASWSAKTAALIKAADDVIAKKPNALTDLQKAGNCKNCHTAHKGD